MTFEVDPDFGDKPAFEAKSRLASQKVARSFSGMNYICSEAREGESKRGHCDVEITQILGVCWRFAPSIPLPADLANTKE